MQARTSRPGSCNTLTNQQWPPIYPLHMQHNQPRCRNRRTVVAFPPRSRCMLQCRLSFCICQLRMTRMFPTLLFLLHCNSRPPPPSPEYTQRTRLKAPRRKAACRSRRARIYTSDAKRIIAFIAPKKQTRKHASKRAARSRPGRGYFLYLALRRS